LKQKKRQPVTEIINVDSVTALLKFRLITKIINLFIFSIPDKVKYHFSGEFK